MVAFSMINGNSSRRPIFSRSYGTDYSVFFVLRPFPIRVDEIAWPLIPIGVGCALAATRFRHGIDRSYIHRFF
jgi:hypothetical protein